MRGPERVIPELTYGQCGSVTSQADLNFVDFRHNLVNIKGWFITEATVLCDAVETGQRVDTRHHITVYIVDVRHG